MIKRKFLTVLLCMGISIMAFSACSDSNSDAEDTAENTDSDTKENEVDATLKASTLAYLDAAVKGELAEDTILDSQSIQTLQDYHLNLVDTLAFRCLNAAAPAMDAESPSGDHLTQSQTLWEGILTNTRYEITQIQEDGEEYLVTLQTEQMLLYKEMYPILSQYMNQNTNSLQDSIHDMLLTACTEAYSRVTYREAEPVIVRLSADENGTYYIANEDLDAIISNLVDVDSIDTQFNGTLPENLVTEASPNQEFPDDLDTLPEYSVGESFILQENGKDAVRFSIDKVEVTEDRSEYVSDNPDKVIVITYTYQNLGLEDPLLFDQMSFQVLDGKTVCDPYYLPNAKTADLALKDGSAITSDIAYGISAKCDEIIICFKSSQITSRFKVATSLNEQ